MQRKELLQTAIILMQDSLGIMVVVHCLQVTLLPISTQAKSLLITKMILLVGVVLLLMIRYIKDAIMVAGILIPQLSISTLHMKRILLRQAVSIVLGNMLFPEPRSW